MAAEVLPADLTDPAELAAVAKRCAATAEPIDLLVNNAGIWSFGPLTGPAGEVADTMVALNVAAVVTLSRAAVGPMVGGRAGHHPEHLVPSPGRSPCPTRSVYAASKAFVTFFGQGLHEELRDTGVGVTTVTPGLTRSELARPRRPAAPTQPRSGLAVDGGPSRSAHLALKAAARRRVVHVPGLGLPHRLQPRRGDAPHLPPQGRRGRQQGPGPTWPRGRRRPPRSNTVSVRRQPTAATGGSIRDIVHWPVGISNSANVRGQPESSDAEWR